MGNTVSKIRDLSREGSPESTTPQRPDYDHGEERQPFLIFERCRNMYRCSDGSRTAQDMKKLSKTDCVPRQRSSTVSEGFKKAEKVFPVVFKWRKGGKDVQIGGTFNNWKTIPMVKSAQDFVTVVDLPEGEHQFKFFVNGEWIHDPSLRVVDDGLGAVNNLIEVKKADFDVFQALAMDSFCASKKKSRNALSEVYSQDRQFATLSGKPKGPPILPPHLLHNSMNAELPSFRGPELPEPNHVTLNHLHTKTIGDGVLEVSTTHRFREKYVTTVLYKPID